MRTPKGALFFILLSYASPPPPPHHSSNLAVIVHSFSMSIFWSILDVWPSTVLCKHFNFLLSSELPYPACQNYFPSPGGLFRMEAGHREKFIVSLNPSGFKILLTSMPIAAWQHQSARSHHSSQLFYYSQVLCIRVPYTKIKGMVYSLLLSIQTQKQLGWIGGL